MAVVDSKIWGPYTWYLIHQIGYSYIREKKAIPAREQRLIRSFMLNLRQLLPCPSCRAHFGQTLSRYPINKENRNGKQVFNWTIRAHNFANKGLKKKVLTYAQADAIHKKNLVHQKLIQFIATILIQSTNKPLSARRALGICLANLYPCACCRPQVLKYYRDHNPKNLKTQSAMTDWLRKLLYTCRSAMKKCTK